MQTVLIIIHLIIVLALIGVVLLQRSEGGGWARRRRGGGVSGFMTGRGQANALTRATAILAGLFFLTSIALTDHGDHDPGAALDPRRRRAGGARASRLRPAAGRRTCSSSCSASRAISRRLRLPAPQRSGARGASAVNEARAGLRPSLFVDGFQVARFAIANRRLIFMDRGP